MSPLKFLTRILIFITGLFLLILGKVEGQQAAEPHINSHSFKHFRIGGAMGYTFLSTNTSDGKETLVLPSLGLDTEYWINSSWGIGLHNDIELLIFEVEHDEDLFVEREFPLLFTLDVLWKPYRDLVFYLGPGIEIEPNENYFVFRWGLEYEISIRDHWDLFPTFFYDYRKDAYDTFTIGLGIGKRF